MANPGDAQFPVYFAVGMTVLGIGGALAIGTSAAMLAGRAHLQRPAWSTIALVVLASWQLLGWGVVHGAHGLYTPTEERLEAIMDGVAPALNAFGLGMLSSTIAAFLMVLAGFRQSRAPRPTAQQASQR